MLREEAPSGEAVGPTLLGKRLRASTVAASASSASLAAERRAKGRGRKKASSQPAEGSSGDALLPSLPSALAPPAPPSPPPRVLVVGAGVSGLSAAHTLRTASAGTVEVVVLEGRNRLGGRVHTVALGNGSRVDLGASYIHGCNNPLNKVFGLAQMLGVELRREYGGYQAGWLAACRWYHCQGHVGGPVLLSEVNRAWRLTQSVQEALSNKADDIQRNGDADMSVSEFIYNHLPRHLHSRLTQLGHSSRLVFDRLVRTVWGYVSNIDNLSVRIMAGEFTAPEPPEVPVSSSADETAPAGAGAVAAALDAAGAGVGAGAAVAAPVGAPEPAGAVVSENGVLGGAPSSDDEDAYVVNGYHFLVDHLARDLDVRMEKNVSTIVTRSGGGALVCTRDGDEFLVDCVIVTAPLSVLQGKHSGSAIRFVPPLSAAKQRALDALAMGSENKVILRFSQPFWPADATPYFQVAGDVGLRFVSLHHYGKPGVLVAHLSPPHSDEIRGWPDAQVRDWVLEVLRGVFGVALVNSVECVECVVTRWHEDMFSMGAYSYMPVGSTFADVHTLAQAEGCLFFAGEATSAYDGQCVTGAFDSGAEAAKEALAYLQLCECEVCGVWVKPVVPRLNQDAYFACVACDEKQQSDRYCICKELYDDRVYIECERCEAWFHLECMGLAEDALPDKWFCGNCTKRTTRGRRRGVQAK